MSCLILNLGCECDKNVDNYYGSHITVWIPQCASREAFYSVKPLHGLYSSIGEIIFLYFISNGGISK